MTARHMLQQGLRLDTQHYAGLRKHGPHRRAHDHMSRKTRPERTITTGARGFNVCAEEPPSLTTIGHRTTVSAQERTSLKFGWVKMFYLYSPVCPDAPRRRIPDIRFNLPCVARRVFVGAKRRRRRLPISAALLFPARVVVPQSHPVLATGPCWHSFSQRHVTTSLHNSEARVLLRVPDWPKAAEARPKRSVLIGCVPINSVCHV